MKTLNQYDVIMNKCFLKAEPQRWPSFESAIPFSRVNTNLPLYSFNKSNSTLEEVAGLAGHVLSHNDN